MFMSAVEPTDDDQSSQFVPFTRYLPEDETLGITAVDLVRRRLTVDLGSAELVLAAKFCRGIDVHTRTYR